MSENSLREWALGFDDLEFVQGYHRGLQTGLALQLLHMRLRGYFPSGIDELPANFVEFVSDQLGCKPSDLHSYAHSKDRVRRHRRDILKYLRLRRANDREITALRSVLISALQNKHRNSDDLVELGFTWTLEQSVYVPSRNVMMKLTKSVQHEFQDQLVASVAGQLSMEAISALDACLSDPRADRGFQRMKDDVGAATLDNVLNAAARLAFIQDLDLPFDVIRAIDPSWIKLLSRRVEGETASEMRRHNREKRLGLLAIYLMSRRSQLIDGLVDLLIEVVHRIDTGFLNAFETSASREALPRHIRDQRLLLCLYGLGTNAGLKRVAAGTPGVSYDELKHKHTDRSFRD